jgi:hypothetical protein
MDSKSYTEYLLEIGCSEKLIVGIALLLASRLT